MSKLEKETIVSKNGEIFQIEKVDLVEATNRLNNNKPLLDCLGEIDVTAFEERNRNWIDVNYDTIESMRNAF